MLDIEMKGGVVQAFLLSLTLIDGRLCPDPICPMDVHENQTILLPCRDCSSFFFCVMGFPTLLACPPGLRFNESVPGCVPEDLADCSPCEENKVMEERIEEPVQNNDVFQLLNYFKMPYN